MTFNASSTILGACVLAKSLVPFEPTLRQGETIRRHLFVAPGLHRWLACAPGNRTEKEAIGFVVARFKAFVIGDQVDDYQFFKALRDGPPGLWEIRTSHPPRMRVRVFGGFFERDVFIATNHQVRSELDKRTPRGTLWDSAMEKSDDIWHKTFGDTPRLPTRSLNACVSENVVEAEA